MRIISLSPSVTETLVLLGLEDEIVGITPWCRMYLKDPDNKIIVGSYLTILRDRIELLKPDIIFLQSRVQDKLFWILKEKGFNTFLIPLPTNVYSIISHIVIDVGSIVGRYYEAREIAERLIEAIARIRVKAFDFKNRLRTYIEYLWPDKSFSSAGSLTYIDDMIRIAGGENIFRDYALEFFAPTDLDIIKKDPQIILVNIEPVMKNINIERYLEIRPILKNSTAYKYQRIFLVQESKELNLAHFGPSFIKTIEWIYGLYRRFS